MEKWIKLLISLTILEKQASICRSQKEKSVFLHVNYNIFQPASSEVYTSSIIPPFKN